MSEIPAHAQKYPKTLFTRLSVEDSETMLHNKLEMQILKCLKFERLLENRTTCMQGQKKDHKIGLIEGNLHRIITDDKKKAESFNQYFVTVCEKLTD